MARDPLADVGHHQGTVSPPLLPRCHSHRFDVPGSDRSAVELEVSLDDGRMSDDHSILLDDEVDTAERVLPVVVRESLILVRPEGFIEDRPDGDALVAGQVGRLELADDAHASLRLPALTRKRLAHTCDYPRMAEYGNGVSGVAGQVTGSSGGGAQTVDSGSQAGQFINDSVQTLSTLPPAALLGLGVAVFLGLLLLKKAF